MFLASREMEEQLMPMVGSRTRSNDQRLRGVPETLSIIKIHINNSIDNYTLSHSFAGKHGARQAGNSVRY